MSWRRILLLSLLFVTGLAAATWFALQRSDAATSFVRRQLAEALAAPSTLDATELDLGHGRLTLRGLRIEDPNRPGSALLHVDHAQIEVDSNPFGDLFALHGITIDGASVELGPELPRLDQLLRSRPVGSADAGARSLPPVALRNARVFYTPRTGAEAFALDAVTADLMPIRGRPGQFALSGTARLVYLNAEVELRGEIDLGGGGTVLQATLRDTSFDNDTLRRLERQLGIQLLGLEGMANLREVTVQFRTAGPADGPAAANLIEVTGQLENVAASIPGLRQQIRSATVAFTASNRRHGDLRVHIQQTDAGGQLDLTTEITGLAAVPSYSVRATGRDLEVTADVVEALRLFPLGRDLMAALAPTSGRADIEIFLRDAERPEGVAEFDMSLRDVAMAYQGFGEGDEQIGFPLPMVQASGKVRLRDDIVLLEGLTAAIAPNAGGGAVRLDGLVETKAPAGEDTTLDIRATGVTFNADLRAALMGLLHDEGQLYDRLAPSGRTDVELHVRPSHVLDGGWALTVRPQAAAMLWGGFPYRLDQLTGTVVARGRGVEFDLTGAHGDGHLTMRGHIPLSTASPDGIEGFEAAIEAQQIAIDEDLQRALAVCAPMLTTPWTEARPSGHLHGRVKVWRPSPTEPLNHDLQLELDGVALALPCAPWRATGLSGTLFAQGAANASRLDFDALRGQLEHGQGKPAQLAMLGTLNHADTLTGDLAFVVRGLELDAQLGSTLEQLGALGTGTWAALQPSGTVDLVCRHTMAQQAPPQLRLVVELVDVAADAPMLPHPARHMTGELQVANGELTFRDVRAQLGTALVRCQGGRIAARPAPDGRTELSFAVAATGFPLDDGLARMFSGPLRQAIADRHVRGRADIDGLQLRFLLPASGQAGFETELSGQLRLYDVAMALGAGRDGITLDGITGVVTLDPSQVGDAGGQLLGMFRRGSLRVFGQPFEAIEARFTADAERLSLPTFTGRLHGGVVRGGGEPAPSLHYALPCATFPKGRLAANLAYEKVDVFAFLRECGWQHPPYSGSAKGHLVLDHLDGASVVHASGTGDLLIERGDLGAVPLFTAIYAQLPAPERPRFERLSARFHLDQRRLDFEKLSLRSNLLEANGTGSLELDGYLDVKLKLDNLLGPGADPLLMPFVDFLTQNIVSFHLFGHLRDLHAEKRWVTERSPARRKVLPMPPFRERPARPDY